MTDMINNAASTTDLAFVFPGQGAQSVGMVTALAAEFSCFKERFQTASEVLGFDLWTLVATGPENVLNRTENTQPALLAASVATWDAWIESGGPRPQLMAGHSFGEYSALVCAGALDYADAIALVADRGRRMQEAVPEGEGAMAAILGLGFDELAAVCVEASTEAGVCSCANLNAPGQTVIAGTRAAVEKACALATARGAKRARMLPVSVPAHCALMRPAAVRFGAHLDRVAIGAPGIPVLHNADVLAHADPAALRAALIEQLYSPVRWIEIIERFATLGVRRIYECGPGKVLTALIKRINRELECQALGDPAIIRASVAQLNEEST